MIYKCFSLVVLLTVLQSGKGEDYVVALAYRGKDSYIRYTAGETGGLMEIQYPHFAKRTSNVLGPFQGTWHPVSDKMKITSVVENTAVVVSGSDENVNIVVAADGVFSPLPISALGTKYILPSSLVPNSSYQSLLLIATHNMSTNVDISFRIEKGSVNFVNYVYGDGDTLPLKLDPYQTVMMSTPHDLNGTVINSGHSVAVYSGIDYASKYTVYDQLLPVKHHGQEYVVAVDDTKLELQIISEHSHVQITFSTWATVSTGERRLYNRSLEQGESLHFTTTRPVLVTLSRTDGYSSVFTTVPPVHSYVTHRGVWFQGNNLNTTLKIITEKTSSVLIKNKQLNDVLTWTDVPGSRYKVGTVTLSPQQYTRFTSISSDLPFTALSFYNGSVHNIGYNVSAEEAVHYTGESYLMAVAEYDPPSNNHPRILATAGETGGQWQVQDPLAGRVWSRRFNPYNTDYFYPNTTTTKVVLVRVRAAVHINVKLTPYTSFSPLPVSALGTKYIISSCLPTDNIYRYTRYRVVLVIATHSKKADVDIIFRLEGNVTYKDRAYSNGDTLSIRLDKYQTFSITSSSDMTRTIVKATETIAVYSGTYYTTSKFISTYEQLLPVKHYGSEYIVAIKYSSYYRRKSITLPYQLQVVTDHSDSSIMFNNGSSVSVGKDGLYREQCGPFETFYFNTTKPTMVTLCSIGMRYKVVPGGLIVVPPVTLYSKQTTLKAQGTRAILTDKDNNNLHVQEIPNTLSTVFTPPIKWKEVPGTRYKVGILQSGQHITAIRSNSSFAVLGYDYDNIYNGGYNFRTHLDAETSTPDGNGNKLTTDDSFQAEPDNAALIVGIICGIVIVALLVVFMAYAFYTRRKMMPVKRVAEQDADAPPTSNIYTVLDSVAEGAADEATYTGLTTNCTPVDVSIVDSAATYVNFDCGK
ncbi:uncharacterized protein LOC125376982 [Haliotis rufescens]|uniref:uncharacterized protein LOC125376982 n=1 Tax=Haliotis rufescens TaxID=6454 RepID=UPI00201E7A45|nr:uncharacterized protein LOC125376982 [Haliotis rufescens]